MAKKIITSVIVLAALGCGIYFGISKLGSYSFQADIGGIETPEIQMPFESGLGELELSNFDIGVSLPANLFGNIFVETDLSVGAVDLQTSDVSVGTPSIQSGLPPADWEPDEATCSQFKAVPSCMFVPSEYRDLCEKCKNK
jgi:hypothetical protein